MLQAGFRFLPFFRETPACCAEREMRTGGSGSFISTFSSKFCRKFDVIIFLFIWNFDGVTSFIIITKGSPATVEIFYFNFTGILLLFCHGFGEKKRNLQYF